MGSKGERLGDALSGFLGALVGGALSLAGVYLTTDAQTRQREDEMHRQSYVKVLSAAEEFRVSLEHLQAARDNGDLEAAVKADAASWDNAAQVYAADVEAELIFSNEEMPQLQELMDTLFHDPISLEERLEKIPPAMIDFADQGRQQFGKDVLAPSGSHSPNDPSIG